MSDASQLDDLIRRAATAVLVACIAILGVTAGAATVPAVKDRLGWSAAQQANYVLGQQIDVPASAYAGANRTLLFFSLSSCGACQKSKPTVAGLVTELSKHPDVRVVMVTGETFRKDETAFARTMGVDSSRILRLDLTKLKLKRVPALVLVNAQGRVLLAQEGVPTDLQRRDIISAAVPAVP